MGSYAYRWTVYYGFVIHYDNDGIWTIFQAIYVHSTCSDSPFYFCVRTITERGQEIYKKLLCRFAGGSGNRACLHYLLPVRFNATGSKSGRCRRYTGMGIYWRVVPFANKFPKNTKLYKLMTTKPVEGA